MKFESDAFNLHNLRAVALLFVIAGSLAACASLAPSSTNSNAIRVVSGTDPIPFEWRAANVGDRIEPYHALLVPVQLNDMEKIFYMQFDLGAQSTLFYRAKIESIRERQPEVTFTHSGDTRLLTPTRLRLGSTDVFTSGSRVIDLKSAQAVNWSADSIEVIGTLGADLIAGHVVVIDYPGKTIRLLDSLPESLAKRVTLVPMSFQSRRIFLSGTINGEVRRIIYDTGSSAFELLTDDDTWRKLAREGSPVETYDVKSWDNTLTTHSAATDATVEIGGVTLPLRRVTRVDGVGFFTKLAMRAMGVGGLTGNKLFIERTIIIDTQSQKIGVVK
jgi:hypothetical protein